MRSSILNARRREKPYQRSEKIFAYGSNMCSARFRHHGVIPDGQGRAASPLIQKITDTVLEQLECYMVALITDLGPGVPYHAIDHGDGRINRGFRDLRGHPDRAESLHEAIGKPSTPTLLRNRRGARNLSLRRSLPAPTSAALQLRLADRGAQMSRTRGFFPERRMLLSS